MNYFELHIVDYQRKTAHLSLAEHGAYSLMLQTFYATERPLPADRKVLCRLLRADTPAERKAIDSIATQFWQVTDLGLTNKRADEMLENYRRWVEQQKANGKRGGRRSPTHGLTDGEPIANPTVPENITQIKPNGVAMGGDRAFPNSDSHSDSHSDQDIPTPTPPLGGVGSHRRSPARAEKDAALEVWNRLVATDGAEPKRDSRLQAAIDAVGGWSRIAQRETGIDAQRVQRDFVDAYRSVNA